MKRYNNYLKKNHKSHIFFSLFPFLQSFKRYQTAQILLHSLSQQINNNDDRYILNRYREAVEKRLYYLLQNQGSGYNILTYNSP